jgi:4-hydroxy-3-methylbut-2-en-1-yl diphosphate reductase
MKSFDIPQQFSSSFIDEINEIRNTNDRLKKDFSPSLLSFENADVLIARHFGFCYGVKNAVEIAFKVIADNPDKKIYLLSEIIHNPSVNESLLELGVQFIQDEKGNQIIEWSTINSEDIVITPAFGTTNEIQEILNSKEVNLKQYDTTCPFVEKVWKRGNELASNDATLIIHGKTTHEETRATFSQTSGKRIIVESIEEAKELATDIRREDFDDKWKDRVSDGFNFEADFDKIGVINQTTMLAEETHEIAELFKNLMIEIHSESQIQQHFVNTRDTLCYATNDNQSATKALAKEKLDLTLVIGGYNSSNTSHLLELFDEGSNIYFIKDEQDLISNKEINHFNLANKSIIGSSNYIPNKTKLRIGITAGASCPNSTIEEVIKKLLSFKNENVDIQSALSALKNRINGF